MCEPGCGAALLAKLMILVQRYGANHQGRPALTSIAGIAASFEGEADIVAESISQQVRNCAEYQANQFMLSHDKRHPLYCLDILPLIMKTIGVHLGDWNKLRPGSPIDSLCCVCAVRVQIGASAC